jgi:hypothetical protein
MKGWIATRETQAGSERPRLPALPPWLRRQLEGLDA